tara:strand:- start:1105 stop:1227 length:123 start_codon:yes stop_codon:yes gene_type:complete
MRKLSLHVKKTINGVPQDEENPSIINADRGIAVIHENLVD